MFSILVEGMRNGKLLITPTLGAVLAATGMAMAQPGSDFQDRGNHEAIGTHFPPRANSYVMQAPAFTGIRERAFARTSDRALARSVRNQARRHR